MDIKLSAIKAIVCQDCEIKELRSMRSEKEIAQALPKAIEKGVSLKDFGKWMFYKKELDL